MHNLAHDPPFTRVHLVSCRNLLISMHPQLQQRVLSLFHYAVIPDRFLLLGPSETVGELTEQFKLVDPKWKLFRATAARGCTSPRPSPSAAPTSGDGPRRPSTTPAEDARMNLRLRHRQGRYVCVRCTYRKRATEQGLELELGLQLAIGLRSEVEDRTILTNFIAMMENTDDYIYFKDRNHVFTGASQTLVSITEPSEHWTDLIGKTDYDVFPEEYADRYYSLEKRVFSGAVEVAQEIQPTLDNHGHRGWVDNRKYPIKDADGAIIGLFGVARDITATKVAEDERREALERLQKIARLVPGVVYQFLLRPDGRASFPYISDAVRELYQASPEEAGADAANVFASVHPDDLPELLASTRASARELTPWVNEHRVRFVDGTVRYLFGRGTPQRLEDGSVLWHGFVSDITDATERKRTEADLRIAATAFETREGMMVTDAQGVILKVNRAFTAISGFGASEVVGRTPELLRSDRHDAASTRRSNAPSSSPGPGKASCGSGARTARTTRRGSPSPPSPGPPERRPTTSGPSPTRRSAAGSRSSCTTRRSWRPSAGWPAASPTTSTTCSPSSSRTPSWPSTARRPRASCGRTWAR